MSRVKLSNILLGIIVLFLISLSADATGEANENQPPLVTIPFTAVHILNAKEIDPDFRIEIALPFSYQQSKKSYPVIYLTDGNGLFPIVTGNVRQLLLGREVLEAIIVGIDYNLPKLRSILTILSLRSRDLTPTSDNEWVEMARKSPLAPLREDINPGGAKRFLSFIDNEVKPFVNSHYRTNLDNQTLAGYSFGGLFAFYVLMNSTDSFDNYVIGSPSFWWDQGICFEYEENYSKTHEDLRKRVFMSFGSLEEIPGNPGILRLVNLKSMADRLRSRNYPNLMLEDYVFDGETHLSGPGTSINRGLRFVLGKEFKREGKLALTIDLR